MHEQAIESLPLASKNRTLLFRFAEPMVFDLLGHLGDIDAETEIKYLSIIPLNGDPFIFIPGELSRS